MDLWAELQSTKDTLRMTEDEVTACKREKVRFLETLTKISVSAYVIMTHCFFVPFLILRTYMTGRLFPFQSCIPKYFMTLERLPLK